MAQGRFASGLKRFAWVNKEGAIVGLIIGAIFAFFEPLYVLSILIFSYATPFGWDYQSTNILKILLPLIGMTIGIIIDMLINPQK